MVVDFAGGDPRFIYAARRDGTSGLVELPDGQADEYREMTRVALKCPVPWCPSPEITTVGGAKRHHYRHLVKNAGTEHGPETYFHLEAKAVVEQWLRDRYPGAEIELEKRLGGGERIADVFATLPTGERYAIEVQFSSLTVEAYTQRHEWYERAGIVDVWLFIHRGVHLRSEWGSTATVHFSPTHEAVAKSGRRVLWINPMLRAVGYGTRIEYGEAGGKWTLHATTAGTFVTEPLGAFHLDPRFGITSHALSKMDADGEEAAHVAALGQQRAKAARIERDRRLSQEAADRAESENARRQAAEARAVALSAYMEEWAKSDAADAARAAFPMGPPTWIEEGGDLDVSVPSRCWRWHLYSTFVLSKEDGAHITYQLFAFELRRHFPGVFSTRAAAQGAKQFIGALAREGLIRRSRSQERAGWWEVGAEWTESPALSAVDSRVARDHLCGVCGKPMDPALPWMQVHFVSCERRFARRTPRA